MHVCRRLQQGQIDIQAQADSSTTLRSRSSYRPMILATRDDCAETADCVRSVRGGGAERWTGTSGPAATCSRSSWSWSSSLGLVKPSYGFASPSTSAAASRLGVPGADRGGDVVLAPIGARPAGGPDASGAEVGIAATGARSGIPGREIEQCQQRFGALTLRAFVPHLQVLEQSALEFG